MTDSPTNAQFAVLPTGSGQAGTITVTGEIDLANAGEFRQALTEAAVTAPALTVDLSAATYFDSAGVRALFSVAAETPLTLIVPEAGPITTLVQITGLPEVATIVTSDTRSRP
jgi:anti-anti-sigma factor